LSVELIRVKLKDAALKAFRALRNCLLISPKYMFKLAILSAILFLFSLHPISGWPGGLVYLFVGWALPSFSLFVLCAGIATLLCKSRIAQLYVLLSSLFALGINTDLLRFIDLIKYTETTKMEIRSVAQLINQRFPYIDVQYMAWPRVYTRPFGARVQVSGDEGCGCFYFVEAEGVIYSDRVIKALKSINNKDALVMHEKLFSEYKDKDIHLEMSFFRYLNEEKLLMSAEIYELGTKTAEFIQEGIPLSIDIERKGIGRERIHDNFIENAFDILLHDNFVSYLMNSVVPDYYPKRAMDKFLKQAVFP
jgi:hypothetical protein